MESLLDLNARIEASEREMNMGAGYGVHYLMPYRGADENVSYDFVSMTHFYSAKARSGLVAGWPEFSEMMNEKGYFAEFQAIAECGPISTFRTDWLYNSAN